MSNEKIKELEDRVAKAEAAAKEAEQVKANILAMGTVKSGISGGGDEAKAMRYFGCPSIKQLLNVNTGDPRFKHVPDELKFLVQQFKQDWDTSRMMQQLLYGEQLDRGPVGDTDSFSAVKGILDGNYFAKNVLAPKVKAFGTGVANAGAEWVPTLMSSSFLEEYELDLQVVSQFQSVNMPSSPFDVPKATNPTTARRQVESCDPADNVAAANFGTDKITLSAEKLVEYMCLPEELNEDSAPQILALVRREVSEAQGRAFETAILNGDTAGTHQDSDVTGVVDARTSWDGLRKLAIANSATEDFTGGAVGLSGLRTMRSNMGKFGVRERELVWLASPKVYQQMLDIDEVTTVEKFGPMATILRGSLAALDGIPIVITEYNRDDLNASGVYDGITTNLSEIKLVNRTRFMWGVRRPIRVRAVMDPTPPGDRWLVASWWRGDFQGHAQSASEVSVSQGINIG